MYSCHKYRKRKVQHKDNGSQNLEDFGTIKY